MTKIRDAIRGADVRFVADKKAAERAGVKAEDVPGIELIDDAAAEEADVKMVVCIPAHWPTEHTDNQHGRCIECAQEIQFRPRPAENNIAKVCVPCFMGVDLHPKPES